MADRRLFRIVCVLLLTAVTATILCRLNNHDNRVIPVSGLTRLHESTVLIHHDHNSSTLTIPDTEITYEERQAFTNPISSMTFKERSEEQQRSVSEICQQYPPLKVAHYPDILTQRLWYVDPKEIIFCAVPKIASTTMNYRLAIMSGHHLAHNATPEQIFSLVNKLIHLDTAEQAVRLQNYFRFTIVRNPFERLVSGFRNKLERANTPYFERMQQKILNQYRHREFSAWNAGNRTYQLRPSFKEFVQYFLSMPKTELDRHFRPFTDLCFPCAVKYNFYANIRSFASDIEAVFVHLGIDTDEPFVKPAHPNVHTSDLIPSYFRQLPQEIKVNLRVKLKFELQFYYALFPEDKLNDDKLFSHTS